MDVAALRASWARVEALGDQAAALFYGILFTLAPELRRMFPVEMTGQRDRLLAALGHIVSHVDDSRELVGYLEQLGRDHRRFEVEEHHYPLVGRALLATLQRTLGPQWTPQLAADWAAAYQLICDVMVESAAKAATTCPPWWDATVMAVDRRCASVSVLTVAPSLPYPFHPGQSVAVEYARRPRMWRYLSPANSPRADGSLEFHIRAVAGGQVSPALAYRCEPGERLRLGAPIGSTLTGYRHGRRDLLLIAGGTGLAPLRSIAEALAATGDSRSVRLVAGADRLCEVYDLHPLTALAATMPTLGVTFAVVHGPLGPAERGSAVQVALRQRDWSSHDIYVCGSPRMVAGTRSALREAGYPDGTIVSEGFDGRAPQPVHSYADDSEPMP